MKKLKKYKSPVLDKKKHFLISIDTFDVEICFFINHSLSEMVQSVKKISPDLADDLKAFDDGENPLEEGNAAEGRTYPLTRGYVVSLKFYKDRFRNNISLLSHEVSHLVSWILLERRVELSKNSDEVYAYLTAEIIKKFLFKWY